MATYTFLYDDACPMCKAYTAGFSSLNLSERSAFSKVNAEDYPALDLNRGRHEIPLLNNTTGEVRYGLEAMTTVLANGLPFLRPLLRNPYFISFLKPLYWLITYNRRVIAGTKPPIAGFDCAPDFHRGWRLTYLGILLLLIGLCCWPPVWLSLAFTSMAIFGLLLRKDRLEFLGNWLTVFFCAAVITTMLPTAIGGILAFAVAAWEGWRRDLFSSSPKQTYYI